MYSCIVVGMGATGAARAKSGAGAAGAARSKSGAGAVRSKSGAGAAREKGEAGAKRAAGAARAKGAKGAKGAARTKGATGVTGAVTPCRTARTAVAAAKARCGRARTIDRMGTLVIRRVLQTPLCVTLPWPHLQMQSFIVEYTLMPSSLVQHTGPYRSGQPQKVSSVSFWYKLGSFFALRGATAANGKGTVAALAWRANMTRSSRVMADITERRDMMMGVSSGARLWVDAGAGAAEKRKTRMEWHRYGPFVSRW